MKPLRLSVMLAVAVAGAVAINGCGPTPVSEGGSGGGGVPPQNDAAPVDKPGPAPSDDGGPAKDNAPAADVAAPKVDAPVATPDLGPTPPGGGPIATGPWARNVTIGLVEATQGVFVKVGQGADVVAPAMRNAPLIEGRPIFARVHVTTAAGFTARQLRGVFSIEYPDKTKFEVEDKKMISASSNVERLETTFNFLFPAASIKPGSLASVAIYEWGAPEGADPAMPPRFPATGTADLGIKEGKMELSVVIVPGSAGIMDTPARRTKLTNDIYDLYPVQKVNLRVRAPVTLDGAYSSTKGFAALRTAREMDGAKPYEYYHMVVIAPSAGYLGVGSVPGATVNDGPRRVAITILGNNNQFIDGSTNSTAHEIGHNHGRSHSPGCGAAGADAMYPYKTPPGAMGSNGYSLSNSAFKSAMMWRDLMSYCRPRWISDFQWGKFEARVRIVTGFPGAAMDRMIATRSLQGFAGPNEAPDWGVVAGALVEPGATVTATRYAVLNLADGRAVTVPVSVTLMTDDETSEFAVNLNGDDYGDGDVVSAEVFVDGKRSVVPVDGMARLR